MKRALLFVWYSIGFICAIPAIIFISVNHYFGVKTERVTNDENKKA